MSCPVDAPLLTVDGVAVTFGGVRALDDLSFTVPRGAICGLIGPNGAGKTTLFNVVSRLYQPVEGRVTFDGADLLRFAPHDVARLGIARTFQNLALWPTMSVLENVMVGAHTRARQSFLTAALRAGTRHEEEQLRDDAFAVLDELDLAGLAFEPVAGLPYGTQKLVEVARALAAKPRLVMFDEPAVGLSHAEVDALRDLILRLRRIRDLTVLLVQHHVGLVMGVSDKIVVLNFGRKIAEGAPDEVRQHPAVIEAYLGVSSD